MFLGPDLALRAPAPADIVYLYFVPAENCSVAFYFEDGTCGEIRIMRIGQSDPFTMEDLIVNLEKYTGLQSSGYQRVDQPDLKSIVSIERGWLVRTIGPTTLYIEDFRFFVTEVQP